MHQIHSRKKRQPTPLHLSALRCAILRDLANELTKFSFYEIDPGLTLIRKELNNLVVDLHDIDRTLEISGGTEQTTSHHVEAF